MTEITFIYEQQNIIIQCNKEQKMEYICNNLSHKINIDINSLVFLYGGNKLNLDKTYSEITKENKINILVYKIEDEICSKCGGRIINNKILDNILILNQNINNKLNGLKSLIELMMNDMINKKDINYMNNQLININIILNNILNEDIKKMNNQINQIKFNNDIIKKVRNENIKKTNNEINQIKSNNDININNVIKENIKKSNNEINQIKYTSDNIINNENNRKSEINGKNEIICIYQKYKEEIDLLHNFKLLTKYWSNEDKESYEEGKNNINENSMDIYINDKKILFNFKYKSKENGEIKVKFIFNKLLTNIGYMFYQCVSLKSIDLSSFTSINVKDMRYMFWGCSSLESINMSSINTINVRNMSSMFNNCSSLKSFNLSSFNTSNVNDMSYMFQKCSSLKSIDLSAFNTTNVNNMSCMFKECSSLKMLDLSSFNTSNVNSMFWMFQKCSSLVSVDLSSFDITNVSDIISIFDECISLKRENVKVSDSNRKILKGLKK